MGGKLLLKPTHTPFCFASLPPAPEHTRRPAHLPPPTHRRPRHTVHSIAFCPVSFPTRLFLGLASPHRLRRHAETISPPPSSPRRGLDGQPTRRSKRREPYHTLRMGTCEVCVYVYGRGAFPRSAPFIVEEDNCHKRS